MIEHYNAFISYKHAPEDNKVAEAVHKGLERFHIPRKIRKKTGIKRINRIFRDKDELPITSDLSDSIATALAESDYLIVICSTNTKESAWVPREIECFLKNHSKRDVFTVLVNGEPYDVIPDILKHEERVVTDEEGKERTVRIPIEPLSCDYRQSLRKAQKTELPRLASGIIGCAYDELMNRRRQYRLKQLMAVVFMVIALMAAFCGYMYYSRSIIHKNYLESLRNQSRYLANESESLLEKEQRITALQLALEALPKTEDDDRPVTAEAVKALTDATLAYESNNGKNINAAWNYQMPGIVSDFLLGDGGKKIAIRDNGNVVGVWNTDDHKRTLYVDDLDLKISGMEFLNDTALAVWGYDAIICYDTETGDKVWEISDKEDTFKSDDSLMVGTDYVYICTNDNVFLKIDAASGEEKGRFALPEETGAEGFSVVESRLSPDGKKIAFRGFEGWNSYAYGVLNLDNGESQISELTEDTVKDIEWIGNDKIMLASAFVDNAGSMSFGSAEILSTDHSTLKCINASDLSEAWNADYVCNGVMIESGFVKLGDSSVAYYSGNVITVYDIATGEEKYSNNVNDSLIDVSDGDGDGSPVYITEDGGYATPALEVDTDAVYYNRYFADELRQVAISNGVYARQNFAHEVIYYGIHVYDEEWTQLCEDATLHDHQTEFCMDDKYLVMLSDTDDGPAVDVFGLGDNAKSFRAKPDGDKIFNYKLLGIHNDTAFFGYDEMGSYDLVSVDLVNNTVKTEELFKTATTFKNALTMKDGKLVYIFKTDDMKTYIAIQDIDTGEKKEVAIPEDIGYIDHFPVYYADEDIVCLEGEADYVIDIAGAKAEKTQMPSGWTKISCCSDNSFNGLHALSDGKKIILAGRDGKVTSTISCPGVAPLGMSFTNGALSVLYNDGGLYRYASDSGQFISETDASVYYNYSGDVSFTVDEENDLLYLQMDKLVDVIDTKSGVEIAHITDCFGHHAGRDIFITTAKEAGEDPKLGYYRRYSVNELIEKAHDILKGAELSDEIRSRYGIED